MIDIIKCQIDENIINQNIDDLFIPSNYLISPFSKTEKFLNNEYFLTKEQEEIEQDILTRIQNNETSFFLILLYLKGKSRACCAFFPNEF